jgi:hypothetical protein
MLKHLSLEVRERASFKDLCIFLEVSSSTLFQRLNTCDAPTHSHSGVDLVNRVQQFLQQLNGEPHERDDRSNSAAKEEKEESDERKETITRDDSKENPNDKTQTEGEIFCTCRCGRKYKGRIIFLEQSREADPAPTKWKTEGQW